jgi:hypothetical protein
MSGDVKRSGFTNEKVVLRKKPSALFHAIIESLQSASSPHQELNLQRSDTYEII